MTMLWNLLSDTLIFCLGFVFVSFTRSAVHIIRERVALRNIPGPAPSSFLWGEEWVLYHGTPGLPYATWHKKFGKVVRFTGAFGHQILSITDPRAISFIISEKIYSFPKPRGVRAWFKALLGEGILWVEGKDAHEKQRRALAPALSQQSVRNLIPIFYENSAKLASQWMKLLDARHDAVEIEITNWAARFALDTIGRAAFSYDFDSLSGTSHPLAETLDGLTNNENKRSSFYMRALFWIFPSILSIGKKGEMIKRTKQELGEIASNMWRDAKVAGDSEGRTLMALMCKNGSINLDTDVYQILSESRQSIGAPHDRG